MPQELTNTIPSAHRKTGPAKSASGPVTASKPSPAKRAGAYSRHSSHSRAAAALRAVSSPRRLKANTASFTYPSPSGTPW